MAIEPVVEQTQQLISLGRFSLLDSHHLVVQTLRLQGAKD